jgi:hypothetical protein
LNDNDITKEEVRQENQLYLEAMLKARILAMIATSRVLGIEEERATQAAGKALAACLAAHGRDAELGDSELEAAFEEMVDTVLAEIKNLTMAFFEKREGFQQLMASLTGESK